MLKHRLLTSAILFVLFLLASAPAFAGPAGWSSIDVTVHSEQSGATLLVAGRLPDSASLPADVELALPAGAQVQWAGEILGGPADKDPTVTYTKSTAAGQDVYRFRLTKARTGQIEAAVPGLVANSGAGYSAALKWTPSQDVPEVTMNVRLPRTAQVQQQVPGASLVPGGDAAYSYYTKTFKDAEAGKQLDLSFAYSAGPAPAAAGSASGRGASSPVVLAVVLVAVVGGFVLLSKNVSKKLREKRGEAAVTPAGGRGTLASAKTPAAVPEEPHEGAAQASKRPMSGSTRTLLIAGGVIGVVLTILMLTTGGASAQWTDGKLTKQYGSVDACSKADIAFTSQSDVHEAGPKLLDALQGLEGLKAATVYEAGPRIEVEYCSSSASEQQIRQTLTQTGVANVGQAAPATEGSASLDAAGKKQTVRVDVSRSSFVPGRITAKAGIPVEVAFTQGEGCMAEVVFSTLGVRQDLTSGPATVRLPALEKGEYGFVCGEGHQQGTLLVR